MTLRVPGAGGLPGVGLQGQRGSGGVLPCLAHRLTWRVSQFLFEVAELLGEAATPKRSVPAAAFW